MPAPTPHDLASIVQAGVLAPSAENRHCFEVRVTPEGIAVSAGERFLSAPFHRRILDLVSIGAALENMVIRSQRLGYRTHLEFPPDAGYSTRIAEIGLERGGPAVVALDTAIATRHTNRSVLFCGPLLPETDQAHFIGLVREIPDVSLLFCDLRWQRQTLLGLAWRAETERFSVRSLHDDLFSAVRFELGWHATASEGLPPAALGVEPGMRWAFEQLRRWPVMSALSRIGIHHVLGLRAAYLPCRLAPHCGVLTTRLAPEPGSLAVGRAMQRIWLEAERRGLAFQPLAGAALLALPGYEAVTAATRERLRQGWKALTVETPLMVFRMGHAKAPAIRTSRPSWESFVRA